jgi:hypothetical protein
MKKVIIYVLLLGVLGFCFGPSVDRAFAQEQLTISLHRDFGYGGFGNDIQGLFSIRVNGPTDLAQVEFYIDGQSMGISKESPFTFQFNTDTYPIGLHQITAVGTTAAGQQLSSNVVEVNFVSASQGWKSALGIIIPILVIVFGGMLLAAVIPGLLGRKPKGRGVVPTSYGVYGGAVCPKCGKPFARHWYGINLGFKKLDQCPHCGKWSFVSRATPQELEIAAAKMQAAPTPELPKQSEEELLRKEVDDSRFMD